MKFLKYFGLTILLILIIILLPALFNNRDSEFKNYKGVNLENLAFREISFHHSSEDLKFGGLYFPSKNPDSDPLAIIIHGSGTSNRNNPWYLDLTKSLLNDDISVLLPDKRGSEQSEGDWRGVSIPILATDTESAIDFVKDSINNISFSEIGIIGLSQGGRIVPVVASKRSELNFAINISGTLTDGWEQLHFEEYNTIGGYTYNFLADGIADLSTKRLAKMDHIKPYLDYDPITYWNKVTVPSLILYGLEDENCPVSRSKKIFDQLALKNVEMNIYKYSEHGLLNTEGTYLDTGVIEDIVKFINH